MKRWTLYDDASKEIIMKYPFYGFILGRTEKRFLNIPGFLLGITVSKSTAKPAVYINRENVEETIEKLELKEYHDQISFMKDLLIHELDHYILGHLWSANKDDPEYIKTLKNLAMDSVINGHLGTLKENSMPVEEYLNMIMTIDENDEEMGPTFVGPHSDMSDPTYEEVFKDLLKRANENEEGFKNAVQKMIQRVSRMRSGSGGNQGDQKGSSDSDPNDSGDKNDHNNKDGKGTGGCTLDDHSGFDSDKNEMNQAYARKIVQQASERGHAPGHLSSAIQELLKPKVNWRRYLRRFVGQGSVEKKRETLLRRNRRFLNRMDVPGSVIDEFGKMAVLVDTSGSVSDENLKEFFSEIDKMAQILKKIWLVQYDYDVQDVAKYRRGYWRKIEIKGRGGTRVTPAIEKAIELKCKRAVILTDGYDDFPEKYVGDIKLMFALTADHSESFKQEAEQAVGKQNVFVIEDRR